MKKIKTIIKLQISAGQATPAPPIGPALGQHGLNIAEFCKNFNDKSKAMTGNTLPVEITAYEDRTYTFVIKTPVTSELIKKAAGIQKGSGKALQQKVGAITKKQLEEIARVKMPDLNTNDAEQAMKVIAGTARQMGVTVKEA